MHHEHSSSSISISSSGVNAAAISSKCFKCDNNSNSHFIKLHPCGYIHKCKELFCPEHKADHNEIHSAELKYKNECYNCSSSKNI